MDKFIQILSSPVWWSTIVALVALVVGMNHYIAKIKSEDAAIEEKRRQKKSAEDENLE